VEYGDFFDLCYPCVGKCPCYQQDELSTQLDSAPFPGG
jgi:hypothetical protein